MPYEFMTLEVRGPVGWYRFDRPPRNSVDWDMLYELRPAFETLANDPAVRAIVLASAVDGYFGTGADVSAFNDVSGDRMRDWVNETQQLANAIRSSAKPVLAAIEGIAVGGQLEMSLHADLRFVADNARLGQPEVNIAFIPPVGGTQGLVRLLGRSGAFRMLYGGEIVDAEAAHDIGLADFVVPADALEEEVQAYGEMLATKPANTLAAIRRCLIDGGSRSFDDGMQVERQQAFDLAAHPNFQKGVSAFLEKRTPEWD